MPAPINNKNAQKGDAPASSFLYMRVKKESKARWVRAARAAGVGLTEWATTNLDAATDNIGRSQDRTGSRS